MGTIGKPVAPRPRRNSKQRRAVAEIMARIEDFRSTQEIYAIMQQSGDSIGLTTVYRALQSLADAGEVDVLLRGDGEALYRRCSDEHHHHLVCMSCGRTIEVSGPSVEQWATKIASEHGFSEVSHSLELYGRCENCRENPKQ